MTLFALMHGGAHGGWCWEEVVPRLEALGHEAVAPDLPFGEQDGVAAWTDEVVTAVGEADDVIVVGHSLGGLGVPVVAERVDARHMVFLGAVVPVPGRPFYEVLLDEPGALLIDQIPEAVSGEATLDLGDLDDGAAMPWAFAREHFYQDLGEDVARRAWRRLRAQGFTTFTELCPLTAWPDIPATYILMTEDRSVNPEWSRSVVRGRLDADLIELPGGHSPFYGHPDLLTATLDDIAGRR
jgi:pimeloyl-ACP methyl ester carboxylesterase